MINANANRVFQYNYTTQQADAKRLHTDKPSGQAATEKHLAAVVKFHQF